MEGNWTRVFRIFDKILHLFPSVMNMLIAEFKVHCCCFLCVAKQLLSVQCSSLRVWHFITQLVCCCHFLVLGVSNVLEVIVPWLGKFHGLLKMTPEVRNFFLFLFNIHEYTCLLEFICIILYFSICFKHVHVLCHLLCLPLPL